MTAEINKFETEIFDAEFPAAKTSRVLALLFSKLTQSETALKKFGNSYKQGKFSPVLLDLFNVTMNCKNCPYDLWEPIFYQHNPETNTIYMKINVLQISSEHHVLHAEPFNILKKSSNKTGEFYCVHKYRGPTFAVYNQITDCISPFDAPTKHTLLLKNESVICGNRSLLKNKSLWKLSYCKEAHDFSNYELVQIKHSYNDNYIYCPFSQIALFNNTIHCPPIVFKLNSNISFAIDKFRYESYMMIRSYERALISGVSDEVTKKLLKNIPISENYLQLIENGAEEITVENGTDSLITELKSVNWTSAVICATLVFISVFIITFILFKYINVAVKETKKTEKAKAKAIRFRRSRQSTESQTDEEVGKFIEIVE